MQINIFAFNWINCRNSELYKVSLNTLTPFIVSSSKVIYKKESKILTLDEKVYLL